MEYFSNTFRFNILFNNYIMNENIKKFINVQEASKYPGLDVHLADARFPDCL